jgi:DMSO/TMAO reductase YedYZ heme-binding membrane subunit
MGDLEYWFIARITGLTAFAVLSLSVLSGEALRTSVLDFLAKNRAVRKLHDFTTPLWLPLVFAHVIALVLDKTARIQPVNVVVPFITDYGQIPIGLGTVAFDLVMTVTITSWLRSRMNNTLWMWIHRTSYIAFVAIFFHAALSGTDFDAPLVSALAWSTAAGLAILGISRVVWGRLPA